MKTISCMAVCGMCNRLRAVVSGARLAEFTGRQYECVWDPQNNCNLNYQDQFDPDFSVTRSGHWWRKMVMRSANGMTIRSIGKVFQGTQFTSRIAKGVVNIGDEDVTMIEAGNWFFHPDDNFFNKFNTQRQLYRRNKIKPFVEAAVNAIYHDAAKGQRLIGVHIRGTDNTHCRQHSPPEVFLTVVDRKLQDADRILLATDDTKAVTLFKKRYRDRVTLTSEPPVERNTVKGMRTAVKDLYALARCDVIIGSCGSTYSHMAMGLAQTDDLHIAHTPLSRDTPQECCSYGYYDYDWFKSVLAAI